MRNSIRSIIIIIFIILLQLCIYDSVIKPIITSWGATQEEVNMPMAGDANNLHIVSTRAILINANKSEVWKWLMQLGADRSGFYSYTFIEEAMGYKTRHQDSDKTEFQDFRVGDVVRGSVDEKHSIIPYDFRVNYVKPEVTLVLDQWGTFLLKEVNCQQTRLIIRTQEGEAKNSWSNVASYIILPLHFIMERRTLLGIKARAESRENIQLSQYADMVWFSAIVLSGFLIFFLVFIARGVIQSFVVPCVFSSLLLCTLLLFNPILLYSVSLLIIIFGVILLHLFSRKLIYEID